MRGQLSATCPNATEVTQWGAPSLLRQPSTITCCERFDTWILTWSGFEAAKTAPWPSRGLHHCGKFLEPSDE